MALTREEQTRYDIAKWRWRADLFDFNADRLRSVGFDAQADDYTRQAAGLRAEADAVEAFETVVAEHGGNSPEGLAAGERLRAFRAEHRTDPVEIHSLDGYNEPTAAELGVI